MVRPPPHEIAIEQAQQEAAAKVDQQRVPREGGSPTEFADDQAATVAQNAAEKTAGTYQE